MKRPIPLRRRIHWPLSAGGVWLAKRVLALCPRGWLVAVAWLGAWGAWAWPAHRRLLRANLGLAFPEWSPARVDQTARASLAHLCRHYLEFLWLQSHPGRLGELVTVAPDLRDLITACGASGRPVILVSPHFGCWEFAGMIMATLSPQYATVARQQRNPYLQGQMQAARTLFGGRIIYSRGAVREILPHLKAGGLLGLLVDQNTPPDGGGVFVHFFGVPATMSRAAALFARKLDTELAVIATIRQADGTLHLSMRRPPASAWSDDLALCQAIMAITEAWIREAPTQYLWLYDRWRYLPPPDMASARPLPAYAKAYGPRPRRQPAEEKSPRAH